MLQIPNFKFSIGSNIREKHSTDHFIYLVYDITYSVGTHEWYYNYSYWDGGYEHYCKSPVKCVDNMFEVVK